VKRLATPSLDVTVSAPARNLRGMNLTVKAGETVLKVAFVFRNSDGSKTGRNTNPNPR